VQHVVEAVRGAVAVLLEALDAEVLDGGTQAVQTGLDPDGGIVIRVKDQRPHLDPGANLNILDDRSTADADNLHLIVPVRMGVIVCWPSLLAGGKSEELRN
jgi:hypothetical protein